MRRAALVAVTLALVLPGCGVHGTSGIWNQQQRTNQLLSRILKQLEKRRP